MKERKGVKRQMHFSNNRVRYCSFWEAVVAGREKMYWVRALYHCFSYSSVTSSRLGWSSGRWKKPVSSSFKT